MPTARVGDIDLNYELSGPTQAPVVVLSNSLGTTLAMWDGVVGPLAGSYRVLRYDTRGHGGSTATGRPTSVGELADDLCGLLDALGIERVHLAGLSLGGMTAQAFAIHRPERVASLVLMATAPHLPGAWDERIAAVRSGGMPAIADGVLSRWFTPAMAQTSPDLLRAARADLLSIDPAVYAACCAAVRDMDLRGELAAIVAPTLVLVGADDPVTTPEHGEALRAAISGAELIVLPRAAHLLAVERADAVVRYMLAFLERQAPALQRRQAVAFDRALENRRAVLGSDHVERSLAGAGSFAAPWQDFITRVAWGEVWGDPTLPRKTRSLVTLAMMIALGREEEFKMHLRPALRNGVTVAELQALLLHAAVYAGLPAVNAGFRWTREALGGELDREEGSERSE